MSESSPIKDALYTEIDNLGQEQIHNLLLAGKFSELFERIFERSLSKITDDINEYEKYGVLAESFTHYLFTEMLIPTQRKISFENIELDIVIPNIMKLKKNINDVVLIYFVKTSAITEAKQQIQRMKKIQKLDANIWIISKQNMVVPQVTYTITKESFGKFLEDAQEFVKIKEFNKLNIFKT